MYMKKILCLLYLLSIFCFSHAQNENTYLEQKIDSTLSGMTIREKAGQLNQLDGRGTIENLKILIRKGEIGSVMNVTEPEIVNELQEIAYKQSRTGIPLVFTRDVVHGFKTMLPIPLGQAATFHPELIQKGARISHRSHGAWCQMVICTHDRHIQRCPVGTHSRKFW